MSRQNLFNTLKNVCDFTALESDMDEIQRAVLKDNPQFEQADEIVRRLAEVDTDRLELDRLIYEAQHYVSQNPK